MKIYLTRHGQTNLNKQKLMQGLTDEPLNEVGIQQAKDAREKLGDIHFDAVYASPLDRAKKTAMIIGDVKEEQLIIDKRLIEADFGKYEKRHYYLMGLPMMLYSAFGETFKAPKTVETTDSLISRATSFLNDLQKKDYENVLIVCHGWIIRALAGYLENKENGLVWRPRPKNCQIMIYQSHDDKFEKLA